MCRMIRPAADQGLCVPALPGPCSHHGAQGRETANSLDGFHAAPSQRHFLSFKFLDRQVLFTGIPAVPAAGNRRRVNLRKKTRERAHPCGHRPASRVSVLLGYPVFAAPRWARGFCHCKVISNGNRRTPPIFPKRVPWQATP